MLPKYLHDFVLSHRKEESTSKSFVQETPYFVTLKRSIRENVGRCHRLETNTKIQLMIESNSWMIYCSISSSFQDNVKYYISQQPMMIEPNFNFSNTLTVANESVQLNHITFYILHFVTYHQYVEHSSCHKISNVKVISPKSKVTGTK